MATADEAFTTSSVREVMPAVSLDGRPIGDGTPGPAARAEPHPGGRETILVVEDDAAVRNAAVNILEGLGYRVRQAEDGNAALAILNAPGEIDLLFTDLIMPHGMSGRDLARAARAQCPGLKVLYTSGYSEHVVQGRREGGPDAPLLSKPYRKHKLAEAIRKVLDGE